MTLLAEPKRRNVIRMAGLHLVGAWLIVQVASTVFPAFGLPGWALRGVILSLAAVAQISPIGGHGEPASPSAIRAVPGAGRPRGDQRWSTMLRNHAGATE